MRPSTCERRLGAQHFAHLRAVADGVPVPVAAQRFLGIESRQAAHAAHRALLDRVRALARRRGDSRWRLLGLVGRGEAVSEQPALSAWAAAQGHEGWSEAELLSLYAAVFPTDRRQRRTERVRQQQRALLLELERVAGEQPRAEDAVGGWLEPRLAERLVRHGLQRLGDLQALASRGGRWWGAIPGIGPLKARRIEACLSLVDPAPGAPVAARRFISVPARPAGANRAAGGARFPGSATDTEVLAQWVEACARAPATAKAYRREALRLQLWAALERGCSLSALETADCRAYRSFLAALPQDWISRRRAAPLQPGWAPFAGPLTPASRRQALVILGGCFEWLVREGYLLRNPWPAATDGAPAAAPAARWPQERAFEPPVWQALLAWIESQAASPARDRMAFLLRFTGATGLRAGELLGARLGDLQQEDGRWTLQVRGRTGIPSRTVAVAPAALESLGRYLQARGLPPPGLAPRDAPLVASMKQGHGALGYQALYESVRGWLQRAQAGAGPLEPARRHTAPLPLEGLRHACATPATGVLR